MVIALSKYEYKYAIVYFIKYQVKFYIFHVNPSKSKPYLSRYIELVFKSKILI